MRVPGLETSDLPARSADRSRGPLLFAAISVGLTVITLAFSALALAEGRGGASAQARGALRGTPAALTALFGLCVLLVTLLVLQVVARRRSESALEGTIRRQTRLLQEISAMSTMVELLQACHSQAEANTVIRGALPKLLPGLSGALYVSRCDDGALELQVSWGSAPAA